MALNARPNVTAVNSVASETDGTIGFYRNADNDGGHALWDSGLRAWMKGQGHETFAFPQKDHLPILVPEVTVLASPFVFNVLFSTLDAVAGIWSQVTLFEG
ncbi:MAG: hypothetical protein CMM77_04975 [Rhodospirillaceae bacterium]|nr:hypothetical protein [Rhodospirillaceae bacterium]|tara:strand:+ start:99 stop:401 length:303 start_codon:yes stop_codon:yes gene_type:complete